MMITFFASTGFSYLCLSNLSATPRHFDIVRGQKHDFICQRHWLYNIVRGLSSSRMASACIPSQRLEGGFLNAESSSYLVTDTPRFGVAIPANPHPRTRPFTDCGLPAC